MRYSLELDRRVSFDKHWALWKPGLRVGNKDQRLFADKSCISILIEHPFISAIKKIDFEFRHRFIKRLHAWVKKLGPRRGLKVGRFKGCLSIEFLEDTPWCARKKSELRSAASGFFVFGYLFLKLLSACLCIFDTELTVFLALDNSDFKCNNVLRNL